APVQRIEHDRNADGLRRVIEILRAANQRRDRRVVPAQQVRHREQTRQQEYTSAQSRIPIAPLLKWNFLLLDFVHGPLIILQQSTTPRRLLLSISVLRFAILPARPTGSAYPPSCAPPPSIRPLRVLPPLPQFPRSPAARYPPANR